MGNRRGLFLPSNVREQTKIKIHLYLPLLFGNGSLLFHITSDVLNPDICIMIIHRLEAYRTGIMHWLCSNFNFCNLYQCSNYSEAAEIIEKKACIKLMIGDFDIVNKETESFLTFIQKKYAYIKALCIVPPSKVLHINHLLKAGYENFIAENCSQQKMLTAIDAVLSNGNYLDLDLKEQMKVVALASAVSVTKKEKEILAYLVKGYSREEVAIKLVITPNTVKTHIKNLRKKFDAHDDRELVLKAQKQMAVEY